MANKAPTNPDGRTAEQRQYDVEKGWQDLGWGKRKPPTFTNTASYNRGDFYGEWRWEPELGWVHADLWDEVQRELAQKKISKKK